MNTPSIQASREVATLGGGCFWCVEAVFSELRGVESVTSGYTGGSTASPTYESVCAGTTGHAEAARIIFAPAVITYEDLLKIFFSIHDPTTPNRQGNDIGTAYRSGIYPQTPEQLEMAEASREAYQAALRDAGRDKITTEIRSGQTFYFAEAFHQQYLAKNPDGYGGLRGTGVACPIAPKP